MVQITFIDFAGQARIVSAEPGLSVMQVAMKESIPGIEAECGGACACATCHVYVAPDWSGRLPRSESMEDDMLDFAFDVRPHSRLCCQIKITPELDGLVVHTPERQG
jgi:2Fe-2S ferredoxin